MPFGTVGLAALTYRLRRFERILGGAAQDAAVRMKSRAVARAIPGLLGVVPMHHTAEVRADRRDAMELSVGVPRAGDTLALFENDFSLASADGP